MEKVLILNGSFCELPIIEECKRQGFYVVTTGNMPDLIGHKSADEYIPADYSDYHKILSIVKEHNIRHVLTNANDFGSITAAYVDEQMGWGHHDTFSNANLLHHKDLFKLYVQQKGYPTPISKVFEDKDDALRYVRSCRDYPIIIKANDLTGGKGVQKAACVDDAIAAVEISFEKSRSKRILIEPFITGNQQTFVTFLHNKQVIATASCDSYSYVNPYLIQSETLPASDIETIQDQLVSIIEEMATDLGLADGIFAFQYIRNGEKFQIIEMMRRPFGNQFLKLVEISSGFPWHKAQITAETGGNWDFLDNPNTPKDVVCCGHYGVMASRNGVLKSYALPSSVEDHIINRFVMKKVGDEIVDHLNERIEFIHFQYDTYYEMMNDIRCLNDLVMVDVE